MCFHLDIQKDDAGVVEGTIRADPPPTGIGNGSSIVGPFPPATDPSVGYPPNVSPSDYWDVAQFVPNVDYRILDGVVTNSSFTFWFSPIDLWSTWCALQTPYVWNVNGAIKYRCLPQTATPANTDLGKFDLCTSPDDGAQCMNSRGAYPCACVSDGGTFTSSLPGCLGTECECSATECRANLRSGQRSAMLTLEGSRLVGSIQASDALIQPISPSTFQRATP